MYNTVAVADSNEFESIPPEIAINEYSNIIACRRCIQQHRRTYLAVQCWNACPVYWIVEHYIGNNIGQ